MGDTSDIAATGSGGEKRRLIVNTVVNGLSQFASMLASLVFMPMLVKAFGIVDYGLFMLASSLTAYAGLLDFGVGQALTKLVAEQTATNRRDELQASISSALAFYWIVGFVVALGMLVAGWFSAALFRIGPEGSALLRTMLWAGAAFQLVYWPASTARHVLAGLQRYDVLAITGVAATVLSIAATAYVLVSDSGPVMLVVLNGVVTTVAAVANVVLARTLSRVPRAPLSAASAPRLKAIFLFSWAVFIVQVSDALFYQQTDRLLLGVLASATAVGLYEAAAKFNVLVTYVSGLSVSAVLPLASRMGAQGRHESLRSLFLRGTKYCSALIAPITVVLMVLAGPVILLWLGPRFEGQAAVARVLLLPHVLVSLGLMGDAIVISRGRLAQRVPYIVAQALLNIAISVVLIPRIGVMGVAVGTAVSHLVDFPFHVAFLLKETGVGLGRWARESVLPVYPALIVPAAAAYALTLTPLAESLPGLMVVAAVALLAYWALLLLVAPTPAERAELAAAVSALRSRVTSSRSSR